MLVSKICCCYKYLTCWYMSGLMKKSLRYKFLKFFDQILKDIDLIKRWHWQEQTMQEATYAWTYIINAWHMRVVVERKEEIELERFEVTDTCCMTWHVQWTNNQSATLAELRSNDATNLSVYMEKTKKKLQRACRIVSVGI